MKIYFTRHGQVFPKDFEGDDVYPKGDHPLTDTGEKQASLLGGRLRELKFKGYIYSSPFRRTIQTSEIIARETGSEIIPFSYIHEVITRDEFAQTFRGMTIGNIKERYTNISSSSELEYPWWSQKAEEIEDVCARVAKGMPYIIERGKDCLLVGHGASMTGILRYFGIKRTPDMFVCNCALSCVQSVGKEFKADFLFDMSHLPEEMHTLNKQLIRDIPKNAGELEG